jgi:hypothetical protein
MPKHRATKKYKQRGGYFTNEEIIEMNRLGFTDEQIQNLTDINLTDIRLVRQSLQQINPNTGVNFTPQELIDSVMRVNQELDENIMADDSFNSLNESTISTISNGSDVHDLDNDFDIDFDDNNSLHLSDLGVMNSSRDTTRETMSLGGKSRRSNKKRKTIRKRKGKTIRRTKRTIRKIHRTRKMRGGNVDELSSADFNPNLAYDSKQNGGRNIGANCNDPNFSIYNTRELTLFPYNPK